MHITPLIDWRDPRNESVHLGWPFVVAFFVLVVLSPVHSDLIVLIILDLVSNLVFFGVILYIPSLWPAVDGLRQAPPGFAPSLTSTSATFIPP